MLPNPNFRPLPATLNRDRAADTAALRALIAAWPPDTGPWIDVRRLADSWAMRLPSADRASIEVIAPGGVRGYVAALLGVATEPQSAFAHATTTLGTKGQ